MAKAIGLKARWQPGRTVTIRTGSTPRAHNGAILKTAPAQAYPVRVETPGQQWAYALEIPLSMPCEAETASDGGVLFLVDLHVDRGAVGVAAMASDGRFVSPEAFADDTDGRTTLSIRVADRTLCTALMLRNAGASGHPSVATVHGVHGFTAKDAWADPHNAPSAVNPQASRVPLDELADMIGHPRPAGGGASLPIVEAQDLGARLGFAAPFADAGRLREHPLTDWRMERDDALILSYLYAHHRPQRHLEFGTWEGFGAVLCASACDAEIWTINLPDGERRDDGSPVYSRSCGDADLPPDAPTFHAAAGVTAVQTDSGNAIGWRYRAAGIQDRVHQILCDSREWITAGYAPGFFDSVLIDGGHQTDIVTSDTDKALAVLRPGGLCLWHDFCPDPEALAASPAGIGVVRALVANWDRWRPAFADLFWVRPSWVLAGVRRL